MAKRTEDIIGEILGAAIMASAVPSNDKEDFNKTAAKELRKTYDAFIEVGFTERQAMQLLVAIIAGK